MTELYTAALIILVRISNDESIKTNTVENCINNNNVLIITT